MENKIKNFFIKLIRILVLKWHSIGLSFVSIAYGFIIFKHPSIMQNYEAYQKIDNFFDYRLLSLALIILGIMKLLGVIINNKMLRRISLSLLLGLWLILGTSFSFGDIPNTITILTLGNAWLALGIAVREVLS